MCEQCLHPHSVALWLGDVMTLLSPCVDGFLALGSPPFSGHPEVAVWGLLRMSRDVEELGGSGWLTPSWLRAQPLSSAPPGKAHPERCPRPALPTGILGIQLEQSVCSPKCRGPVGLGQGFPEGARPELRLGIPGLERQTSTRDFCTTASCLSHWSPLVPRTEVLCGDLH